MADGHGDKDGCGGDCRCGEATLSRRTFMQVTGGTLVVTVLAPAVVEAGGKKGKSGGGFFGFFKAVGGVCRTRELERDMWRLDGGSLHVRSDQIPELQEPYGAVFLDGRGLEKPVLLVRTEAGPLLAFENHCTHFGRKLDPVPGEPILRCCSVSHATFDLEGNVLSGPAKGPLKTYATREEGGELVVDLAGP